MKFQLAALLLCGLCLAAPAIGQSEPVTAAAPTPTAKAGCPDTPGSKTAWFDPNVYLLHNNNGVKLGRAFSAPDPQYSETARKAKIMGNVTLAVAINAGGTVDAVKVVCSLEPGLDANAVDAVKQWKFTPATKNGDPVPVQIEVTVGFRLY